MLLNKNNENKSLPYGLNDKINKHIKSFFCAIHISKPCICEGGFKPHQRLFSLNSANNEVHQGHDISHKLHQHVIQRIVVTYSIVKKFAQNLRNFFFAYQYRTFVNLNSTQIKFIIRIVFIICFCFVSWTTIFILSCLYRNNRASENYQLSLNHCYKIDLQIIYVLRVNK